MICPFLPFLLPPIPSRAYQYISFLVDLFYLDSTETAVLQLTDGVTVTHRRKHLKANLIILS